jgi:asparagine synthase (glutamine-hydrolysing)
MCGIAGICWWTRPPQDAARVVDRMVGAIEHRGPDSDGRSSTDFAEVGFRRLAIIDLAGGNQPLGNEDGSIECFLNGEIYNYRALRHELLKRGHELHTDSDTEVLPHLYEELGEEMFTHLNGMFSICVVDHVNRRVLIARDHFGVKQMYYTLTPRGAIFGSELKAVLASGLFEPEIDRASILPYLSLFYCPEPHTLVKGVLKIPPGHWLKLDADGSHELGRYYEPNLMPCGASVNMQDAIAQTSHMLSQSVELQLQADVPVGIALSGGVDSSAIAAFASRARTASARPIALTISWPDTSPEEQDCASELCRLHGLEQEIIQPPSGQPLDELLMLAWAADEPIADPAMYSQLCVASVAARHVKVLLSGAGGDELFGGYGSYLPSWKSSAYANMPQWLQKQFYSLGAKKWINTDDFEAMLEYRDSRMLWHFGAMSSLSRGQREKIQDNIIGSRDAKMNFRKFFDQYQAHDPLNQQMLVDLCTYLPEQVLPMMDRATMACSIEGRVPFLDVPLVEFAFSLCGSMKLGWPRSPKRLLKAAIEDLVPRSILSRKKIGMPSPFPRLIAQEHNRLVRAVLLARDSFVKTILPPGWIESLIRTPQAAAQSYRVLYSLLILEVWHRRFIREKNYARPTENIRDLLEMPAN